VNTVPLLKKYYRKYKVYCSFLDHHGQTSGSMTVSSEDDEDGDGGRDDCDKNRGVLTSGDLVPTEWQDGSCAVTGRGCWYPAQNPGSAGINSSEPWVS
jgi:hypothetical protein